MIVDVPDEKKNVVNVSLHIQNAEEASIQNMDTDAQGLWSTLHLAADRWGVSADLTFHSVAQVEHIERLLAEAKAHLAQGEAVAISKEPFNAG